MRQRPHNPIGDKGRISCVGDMLELAAATIGHMAAGRHDVAGAGLDGRALAFEMHKVADCRALDEASVGGGAVSSRRQPNDQ